MTMLLKFEADWCGPCKALSTIIEGAPELKSLVLKTINVDKEPEFTERFSISALPTLISVEEKDGRLVEIDRLVGVASKEKIKKWLNLT